MRSIGAICLGMAMISSACGGGGDDDDTGDTIDANVNMLPDAGGGGPPDAGGTETTGFADALEVMLGDPNGEGDVIATPGDHDFYKFTVAAAGDWILLTTIANGQDDPAKIDTVITLFDSGMAQIGENDDAVPRVNTDSEIIFKAPAAGVYYVEVQEFSEWSGVTPEGQADFTYRVTARVLPAGGTVTVEPGTDPGDVAGNAIVAMLDGQATMLGAFKDVADIDVYSIVLMGNGTFNFSAALAPTGTDGYGGTAPALRLWLTNQAGTTIIARRDAGTAAAPRGIGPALTAGTYLLFIERGTGGTAVNPTYVAKAFQFMENPLETEVAGATTNDTSATAQALTMMGTADGGQSGFILAKLSTNTDVDYFSFPVANAAHKVTVVCSSARAGSGVTSLRVEVRSGADAMITSQTESLIAMTDLLIDDATPTGTGTHYVRLSKAGQDAEITGDFVRCGMHVGPATP